MSYSMLYYIHFQKRLCYYAVSLDASSRTSASVSLAWRIVNPLSSLDILLNFK